MLQLKLTHSDGNKELNLSAKNLPELFDKIKSWNSWESFMEIFPQTERYKRNPKKETAKEKSSGWYWI